MVTNTPSNGTGGIVYMLTAVPEPSSVILICIGAVALFITIQNSGKANAKLPSA
jgi:hypothetical protein